MHLFRVEAVHDDHLPRRPPPAAMRTLAAGTPRAAASTRSTAAFALPRSAGSRTATFTASPSQPTTPSRDAPGVTFTASLTGPW